MSKDNKYIFEMLSSYFRARHFQSIPTDTDSVSMYASFQKSSLYLVNLIALNDEANYNHDMYERYRNTTRAQFAGVQSDKVILLNILIVDHPNLIYDQVNYTPDLEKDFVDVHWIINSHEKELVIPDKQLKSVLGLEAPIRELISSGLREFYELTRTHNHSYVSLGIIIVNVAMWLALELNGGSTNPQTLIQFGAINVGIMQATGSYWRLLTAIFIHIGFAHLAYNVFSLYIFGSRLEKYINTFQYIGIFVFSGIMGGVFSYMGSVALDTNIIGAGASGGIYGLIGAILILSKAANQPIEGLNSYILWLIFIFGIVYSVVSPNVDAFAHIGGFVGGLIATAPIVAFKKRQLGGYKHEER